MSSTRPLGTTTSIFRGDYSPDSPDAIRLLQGSGVTHIEYFCDEGVPNNSDPSHLNLIKQTAADSGVTIWSVHAPFPQTDVSDVDESFRTASVGRVVEALDVAAALGAGRVVVHGSREPISDEDRPQRLDQCLKSLDTLCREAARREVALALELLPRTCLANRTAETRTILDRCDGDLRVCFDVNHITLYEEAGAALRALGDRIATLHISDHDGIDERHWIVGKGIVDWPAFVAGLDAIGYQGCLMHEARDADLDLPGNLAAIAAAAEKYLR